ncbi:site-specific integrase [Pseudooceanicola onchidii]|uniref:site-specific integrase n=1 Tax=Pseudooceanicola onchidii TaxID=2562279 RepID=UPI00145BF026|nr:site-specific integrase [Pseudooceanicola onchidii]
MGTIRSHLRRDGTTGYTAQVRRKKKGKTIFNRTATFNTRKEAAGWIRFVEAHIKAPEQLEALLQKQASKSLAEVIRLYTDSLGENVGRSKLQCLSTLTRFDFADNDVTSLTAAQFVEFAKALAKGVQPNPLDPEKIEKNYYALKPRSPATVSAYMSYLGVVLKFAGPLVDLELPEAELIRAREACAHYGIIGASNERKRRPTLEELNKLMAYFVAYSEADPRAVPMHMLVLAAIFLTYRQAEHTRLLWEDIRQAVEDSDATIRIRDLKHPRKKKGNDVDVRLRPEGLAVVCAMPQVNERVFPYHPDTISRRWTEACKVLGIEDLHFHDLRHEGISRLFEMGLGIPEVASQTGHKSWATLQRYAQLKKTGDKYQGWPWLKLIGL